MSLFWVVMAWAAMPDKAPATWNWADPSQDLFLSDDGETVAAVSESGTLRFLSVETWKLAEYAGCAVGAVAFGDDDEVWVGCDTGEIVALTWDGTSLEEQLEDSVARSWEFADGPLKMLVWTSDMLYGLADEDGDLTVHAFNPETEGVDESGYPVVAVYDNYVDAVALSTRLVISHGSDDISSMPWAGGGMISSTAQLGVSLLDLEATGRETVLGVDDSGFLVEYLLSSSTWMIHANTLDGPTAVGLWTGTDEEWVFVGDDLTFKGWSWGAIVPDEGEVEVALSEPLVELAAGGDYTFGATDAGNLVVFTALPWVSSVSASPAVVADNSTVEIGFSSDEAGEYSIHLGGGRDGDGEVVAQGQAVVGAQTVQVQTGTGWPEGEVNLVVRVEGDAGYGHAVAKVTVDNPPGAVTEASVAFTSGALVLDFEGISDEDLDHYTIYITTTPIAPENWPTGGPAFDGADEISAPIEVSASGGESVHLRVEPLTNGQTYYLAVRATDAGGLEGPLSSVMEGTPHPAFGAAELSGESGGRPECGPALGGNMTWLILMFAVVGVRRRAAIAAGLLSSGAAMAGDMTPTVGDLEIRYGQVTFDQVPNAETGELEENPIDTVYNERAPMMLMVEVGPQLFRVLEVDAGLGFFQQLAWKIDEDGARSGDRTMMTMWPISISGTLRLQYWDEQVLVPFASYGYDYLMWNERWDDGDGGKDAMSGAKTGTHWALGGNFLLDALARPRASTLEAQTGINDTFVVVEYRRQDVGEGDGLVFSGNTVTAGLKLDF